MYKNPWPYLLLIAGAQILFLAFQLGNVLGYFAALAAFGIIAAGAILFIKDFDIPKWFKWGFAAVFILPGLKMALFILAYQLHISWNTIFIINNAASFPFISYVSPEEANMVTRGLNIYWYFFLGALCSVTMDRLKKLREKNDRSA